MPDPSTDRWWHGGPRLRGSSWPADPFPEPKPPASRWALVRGDHDYSTGKDVAA